ncbi:MAG: hypothetical protein P1U89_22375 [Verrucomicrobiales bacterium]|nr:hypothetical protein [Verrucomicrobiales bacterium]
MVRSLFSAALFLTFILSPACPGQEDTLPPARSEPAMRAELETVYQNWRNAMLRQDLKAWENVTAMYRRLETRNRIISERHPFPEALFDSVLEPPPLNNLVSLNVFTRRDTASAIYFGKADFGVSDPSQVTNTFLVLRFLKEEGKWAFDNSRIVRIGQDTGILHQIAQQDFSFLSGEEFQPLGFIPQIPQPVSTPELMAEAWVTSIGFDTEIWINGHRLGKIQNNMGRELVMGGIRKQTNQITLRTKKIPSGKVPPRFEIAIYAAKDSGVEATRVFHYGPKDTMPGELQVGFTGRILK